MFWGDHFESTTPALFTSRMHAPTTTKYRQHQLYMQQFGLSSASTNKQYIKIPKLGASHSSFSSPLSSEWVWNLSIGREELKCHMSANRSVSLSSWTTTINGFIGVFFFTRLVLFIKPNLRYKGWCFNDLTILIGLDHKNVMWIMKVSSSGMMILHYHVLNLRKTHSLSKCLCLTSDKIRVH